MQDAATSPPTMAVHNVSRRPVRVRLQGAPPWTGIATLLIVVAAFMTVTEPLFFTTLNIGNIFRGMSVPLLLATGTTVLITAGMIDISIASMMALSSMLLAGMLTLGWPAPLAILCTVLFAALVSALINGMLVAKAGLDFFIVTLGTTTIFQALSQIPTHGQSVPLSRKPHFSVLKWFGEGKVGPLDAPVAISLGCLVLAGLFMGWTTFGRAAFAVGGNPAAARLTGIKVDRVRIGVFFTSGLMVGMGAVVLSARTRSAAPTAGAGLEFQAISAVLLGGSSFAGGSGTMFGTFIGVLFIAVMQNALNLHGVDAFWQGVITGSSLVVAVWIDRVRGRRL